MRKARNRNNYKITKALTNAGSAALATAPSGNPFLIAGTTAIAAGAGLMQEPRYFDPNPFRRALKTWSQGTRRRGRRAAQEAGTRSSARLSAKGIGGSELAASITHGAERAAMQHAEDLITERTAEVEDNIAHGQLYVDEANRAEMNRDLQGLASAAITAGHKWADKFSKDNPNAFTPKKQPSPDDIADPESATIGSMPKRRTPGTVKPEVRPSRPTTPVKPSVPRVPPRERIPPEERMPPSEVAPPAMPSREVAPEHAPAAPHIEVVPQTPGEGVEGQGSREGGRSRSGVPQGDGSGGRTIPKQGGTIPRRGSGSSEVAPDRDNPRLGEGGEGSEGGRTRRELIESDPKVQGDSGATGGSRQGEGGRDDQIHPEDAPKDRRPIDPPELPEEIKLDEDSTRADVQEFLATANINPSSRLGQMITLAPQEFGFVVQSFGVEWLKDVFTFA